MCRQNDLDEIKTQSDIDALMKRFGGFHDSCIREAHIWTGYWVSPDFSMSVSQDLDTRVFRNSRLRVMLVFGGKAAMNDNHHHGGLYTTARL